MLSLNTTRLENYTQYSKWIKMAYMKATSLGIYKLIDLNDDTNLRKKLKALLNPINNDNKTLTRYIVGIRLQSSLLSTI